MNSISTELYLEKSFVTFNIFIWMSRGEGFAIFKHVLRGEEINKFKTIEDVKEYLFTLLNDFGDDFLEKNDYSRDEIKEGIKATCKEYGVSSMVDFLF